MPDRMRLVSTLWITLTLLAFAMITPTQVAGFRAEYSPHHGLGLHSHCTLLLGQPTLDRRAATEADAVLPMKALLAEDGEQECADALDEPRVTFLVLCSFRKALDHRLIVPRLTLSYYPLRC